MKRKVQKFNRVKWDRPPSQRIIADSRTNRERTRAQRERAALEAEIQELVDFVDFVEEQ